VAAVAREGTDAKHIDLARLGTRSEGGNQGVPCSLVIAFGGLEPAAGDAQSVGMRDCSVDHDDRNGVPVQIAVFRDRAQVPCAVPQGKRNAMVLRREGRVQALPPSPFNHASSPPWFAP
jgi:hypothetical protein